MNGGSAVAGLPGNASSGLPLCTERLVLRPFRESDWPEVQEYAGDPQVTRYLRWGPNDVRRTRQFLRQAIDEARAAEISRLQLAVVEQKSVRVRGGLSLERRAPGVFEIGYCFARAVWGLGYATEAVPAALDFAAGRLAAAEVFGLVAPGNEASERVLLRCGFRRVPDPAPYAAWRDGLCAAASVYRRQLS